MFNRRKFRVIGLRQTVVRAVMLVATIMVACSWANAILRVTERATEMVVDANELVEFVDQEVDLEPAADAPSSVAPLPQSHAVSERVDESRQPDGQDVDSAAAAAAAAGSEQMPPASETERPKEPVRADEEAATDRAETGDVAASETHTAAGPQPPAAEASGSLASFAGDGVASEGSGPASGSLPGQGLPAWDVSFARRPSLAELQNLRGTRLAAVRQRRGYVEIALLQGRSVTKVTTVAEFLRSFPDYQRRRGVVLDRSWLRPFDERLLPYGGGWEMWLLVSDDTFDRWAGEVEQSLGRQRLAWQQITRVVATLLLEEDGSTVQGKFVVRGFGVKRTPSAIDGQRSVQPPPKLAPPTVENVQGTR